MLGFLQIKFICSIFYCVAFPPWISRKQIMFKKLVDSICWHFLIGWRTIDSTPIHSRGELVGWTITVKHKTTGEERTYISENSP